MSPAELICFACLLGIVLFAGWQILRIESTGPEREGHRAEDFNIAGGDFMRFRGRR